MNGWYAGRDLWQNPIERAHHYLSDEQNDGGVTRICDERGTFIDEPLTDEPTMVTGEPARACERCAKKVRK